MNNMVRFIIVTSCFLFVRGGGSAQEAKPMVQEGVMLDPRVEALSGLPLGPFVGLRDGGILGVGEKEYLVSHDLGATWESLPLFQPDQPFKLCGERALLRTRNGVIILVFMNMADYAFQWNAEKRLPEPDTRLHVWSVRSVDDGKTWVDLQMMYKGYCGDLRDMVQTRNGNVVVPVQELLYEEGRHATRPYVSTDEGKTWAKGNLLDLGGRGHHDGLIEATIEELRDGRLWMLLRTNLMQLWSAHSDDGLWWRVLQPSGIPASSAPAILERLRSGRLVLVWNRPYPEGAGDYPLTGGDGQWSATPVSNHREELSMAFSSDDGKTWTKPVVVARKPKTALSYPYVFEYRPGEIWVTTMQGDLRLRLKEQDFAG